MLLPSRTELESKLCFYVLGEISVSSPDLLHS